MRKVIYQVLPRLWGSKGNSESECGKFSDLDERFFEYVKSLGVTDLWCTGVIRHARGESWVKGDAGSPYAICDYYDVNPYLADNTQMRMAEFEDLIRRVHEAGLKLIIDFVPNHLARNYSGACTPEGEAVLGQDDDTSQHWAPENDFFYYPGETLRLPVPPKGYYEYPAKASGNVFSPAPGINDWYETVKLNYCDFHTATWDKMLSILLFWAGKGVDGFRCDMVELVPREFFTWAIAKVKERFPEVFFVAEVYERDLYGTYIEEVGFDILYDKSCFYDCLRAVTEGKASARSLSWCWQFLGGLQPRMLNFLENHDEQRAASDFFAFSAERAVAAFAVDALFGCAPLMIYAGQEAGERGMDAEGFSGLDGRTSIFDWCSPKSLSHLHEYLRTGKGLSRQERHILSIYKEIMKLSQTPVFSSGKTYDLCYCQSDGFDPDRHFAWLRGEGGKIWLVVSNFSDENQEISVRIPDGAAVYFGVVGLPDVLSVSVEGKGYKALKIKG